jgi:signal transduction histidine kinase
MRLADFIDCEAERILSEWQAFASTRLPAASSMDALALRDHAPLVLRAIAADLRTYQSSQQQRAKAQGMAVVHADAPRTAAEAHGAARAQSGFNVVQMVSEYRALRASVLRLWQDAREPREPADLNDVIRFGEAIDQAIAESVDYFSQLVDRARNLFLGMLGHELRSPLNAIEMTAQHLVRIGSDSQVSKAATRLIDSGARMQGLLDDLLDYSRTTLVSGIRVEPTDADFRNICTAACDELRASHPDRSLELHVVGDTRGRWDPGRMRQVLSNLVLNALSYGDAATPVTIEVFGTEQQVVLTVKNQGAAIPQQTLATLFEPLRRGSTRHDGSGAGHLGLGLFIAREIVKSHRGQIEVRSGERETVFTVRLPR